MENSTNRFYETGIDLLLSNQEIWRFLTLEKADDLFRTHELNLRQVAALRTMDQRESRLPLVIHEHMKRLKVAKEIKELLQHFLTTCEAQANSVYASCWFIPDEEMDEMRMWEKYGGGEEGGIVIISTLENLRHAIPYDVMSSFGIGKVKYIDPNVDFIDAFHLNEYRSFPFLLKEKNHSNDKEIRLYQRKTEFPIRPLNLRLHIRLWEMIKEVRISPICTSTRRKEIKQFLIERGFPKELLKS